MEELKQKILSLINKQGPKIPSMGFDDIYQFPPAQELSINSKTALESDRPADQDILESIEDPYFSIDENYDICRYVLSKLPEVLDCEEIQRDFKNLKQQHQVVSKKVLQLILEHQTACNDEFQRILAIIDNVKDALVLCTQSRKDLNVAEKQLSSSLSILENYRKRKIVQNLLHNLKTIKTLYQTDHRLQELLDEENYAGAIELLQECQAAANTYRHFICVAALTNKLQETLEETEEKLDQVLAQMCYYFDSVRYSKLQDAFKLLGKTQIGMDHLHMHYTSAIYNTALNIVRVYVDCAEFIDPNDNCGKKPFDKLCLSINQETFIPCLVDLCKSLFKIVLSYHQLAIWHNVKETEPASPNGSNGTDFEESFNRQYIKQKLESGLLKIWHDVQSKISVVLLNSSLASYKFDQFVQVLSVVHRLIEVGEEFCGSKSEELQESIRKQSVNYFKNYHANRLEELKIFLENESWEICPVKAQFEILELQEFKSLRSALKNFRSRPQMVQNIPHSNSPDCNSSNHSQDGSSIVGNFFLRYAQHGTPFDSSLDETMVEEDILASVGDEASGYFSEESDEESEELRKDYVEEFVDEVTPKIPQRDKREKHSVKAPILTNTTLTVLRQMGKYLQMSRLLRPIAFDIISSMTQLFDFYLYAVHSFFASDLSVSGTTLYSIKFSATLKRIADDLVTDEETGHHDGKVSKPKFSPIVNLENPEDLHGLSERIAAVESVVFLAKQYEYLQGFMEYLIPLNNRTILQHFYSQTISCVTDLRRPVYMCVAAHAFDLRQILMTMSKVNWEVKDVMSQHNTYIDVLLREVQIFTLRLEQINAKVPVSNDVQRSLWENISHIITHTLVQGFSEAKRCSNGGRALMQLDFTQFLLKFEKISNLRPVPHKEYVENYVKAYYLPEDELEKWIREHNEYSTKHLFGLVSSAYQNNKRVKQRLYQIIEDLDKTVQR